MRINAIQSSYVNRTPQSFTGHWETTPKEKYIGVWSGEVRSYVPDEGESLKDIAIAWKKETKELPHEWVRSHNTYNQFDEPIEYRIKGSPYMPIDVLRASVLLECDYRGNYPYDNIKKYIELAKLAAQTGDFNQINYCEGEMIKNFYDLQSSKLEEGAAFSMDNYKKGLGSNIKYKKRYEH